VQGVRHKIFFGAIYAAAYWPQLLAQIIIGLSFKCMSIMKKKCQGQAPKFICVVTKKYIFIMPTKVVSVLLKFFFVTDTKVK